mmetsp:Transcript_140375/g.447628  ORF Transcript_140375/g.447628 Transcript_140375/m.447628 type:complete len:91 (+) Transcript_140375:63-335(+)
MDGCDVLLPEWLNMIKGVIGDPSQEGLGGDAHGRPCGRVLRPAVEGVWRQKVEGGGRATHEVMKAVLGDMVEKVTVSSRMLSRLSICSPG